MPRKRHSAEEIIGKLREIEVLVGRTGSLGEAIRSIDVTEQTYDCWRGECGGPKMDQARRLEELEREDLRLRKAVADLALDKQILAEVGRVWKAPSPAPT